LNKEKRIIKKQYLANGPEIKKRSFELEVSSNKTWEKEFLILFKKNMINFKNCLHIPLIQNFKN